MSIMVDVKNHINQVGRILDIGNDVEDIWDAGGTYSFYPTTAQDIEILSSDAADSSTGIGARTVQVYGLDSNWNTQDEIVTLNGLTAVDLTKTYLRIYKATVRTAGSNDENIGNIDVRIKGGGTLAARISPEITTTLMAIYTVPNGYKGFLLQVWMNILQAVVANGILIFKARPVNGVFIPEVILGENSRGLGRINHTYDRAVLPTFAAKTDIKVSALISIPNTDIAGGFDLIVADRF